MAVRSRLARRLRRHGRMATLMRSAVRPGAYFQAPGRQSSPDAAPGAVKPARAIVLPPESELPAGQTSPLGEGMFELPESTPGQNPPLLQRSPAVPQAPGPAANPTSEPAGREPEPPQEDADWGRLQRIADLHRARQQAQENPPTDTISRQPEEEVVHDVPPGGGAASGEGGGGLLGPLSGITPLPFPGSGERAGGGSAGGKTGSGEAGSGTGGGTGGGAAGGVGGDTAAEGDFEACADLTVGGSLSAGGSARVGGDANVGAGVHAGTEVDTGGDVSAGAEVSAGTNVQAGGDMTAGGNISSSTNATSTGDMSASGNLETGGAQITLGNSTVSGNVTSGGVIGTTGSMTVEGNAQSAGAILSTDSLTIGGEGQIGAAAISKGDTSIGGGASVGGVITSKGDLEVGGAALAPGGIKAGGDVEIGGAAATSSLKSGGGLEVGGSLTVSGRANIGGSVSAGGSITIHGPTNISSGAGGGTVQPKRADEGPAQVPLQEAWPVQRKAEPGASGEAQIPKPGEGGLPEALAGVSAGRASGSSIEFIPPRRPRPAGAHAVRPALQRSPQPETQAPKGDAGTEVDTEIGPLPSDLWSLIGHTPPVDGGGVQKKAAPAALGAENAPSAGDRPAIGGQLAALETPAPAEIQREAAPAAAADSESGAQGEQTEPDVDIDALARKVYTQLRRRLALEFERMRKFF